MNKPFQFIIVLVTVIISLAQAEVTAPLPYEAQTPRLRQIITRETNGSLRRDLVQLPMKTPNNGPYGSFHYTPDNGTVLDTYINKVTSCAFQNLLNEWRADGCSDIQNADGSTTEYEERGCRVSFGDISHRDYRYWNGHGSHDNGYCIDIRPMRKGAFENAGLEYSHSRRTDYDAQKTAEFMRMAKEYGATNMLFNDSNIRSRRSSPNYVSGVAWADGHNNHMHICIRPENIPADKKQCPAREEALK